MTCLIARVLRRLLLGIYRMLVPFLGQNWHLVAAWGNRSTNYSSFFSFQNSAKQSSWKNQGFLLNCPSAMHLAVLPFDTYNDSPEYESFSNGLAHLVATNLLRMEHEKEELWIVPVREVLSRNVLSAGDAREKFGINLALSGTNRSIGAVGSQNHYRFNGCALITCD